MRGLLYIISLDIQITIPTQQKMCSTTVKLPILVDKWSSKSGRCVESLAKQIGVRHSDFNHVLISYIIGILIIHTCVFFPIFLGAKAKFTLWLLICAFLIQKGLKQLQLPGVINGFKWGHCLKTVEGKKSNLLSRKILSNFDIK